MKKKVLLITIGFPFGEKERGCLPTEFHRLTEEFEVSVLAANPGNDPLLYPFPPEISVWRRNTLKPVRQDPKALLWLLTVPFRPSIIQEIFRAARGCPVKTALRRTRRIVAYRLGAWRCMQFLRRVVKEDKIDLIYTYWCTEMTLGAVLLKKRVPGLKVVTRFRGYDLFQERSSVGWQPFRSEISQGCDRLIFVAKNSRSYYLKTWGERWASKSFVSYLGTPDLSGPSRPNPSEKSGLTLVSCSGMIPLKRVHLIIEALCLLPEDIQVQWHHIGDGDRRSTLTEQAENVLNPLPNIQWKFWGYVPNRELSNLYQKIQPDIFITTTSTEGGVPVSIQEVISAGIPVIGTIVGGVPEIVRDGETGFLLSANPSAQEIADAIQRFFELPTSEKEAMGKAARALWAEEFNAKKNAEAFVQRLKQLL